MKTYYEKRSVAEDGLPEKPGWYYVIVEYGLVGAVEQVAFFGGEEFTVGAVTHYLVPISERAVEERAIAIGFSGTSLLHDLLQVGNIQNEDGMPVIKFVDKPNGGSVAYVRHDAMVKRLNTLVNEYKALFQQQQSK